MAVPYIYEVSFDVPNDKLSELEIGQSLERLIGFMKVRLPAQRGFVFADAVYSVDDPAKIRVVMRSEWSDWADVQMHRKAVVLEDQILQEFDPHVDRSAISVRTYAEVGSGPLSR
jgi:hypothetical protein